MNRHSQCARTVSILFLHIFSVYSSHLICHCISLIDLPVICPLFLSFSMVSVRSLHRYSVCTLHVCHSDFDPFECMMIRYDANLHSTHFKHQSEGVGGGSPLNVNYKGGPIANPMELNPERPPIPYQFGNPIERPEDIGNEEDVKYHGKFKYKNGDGGHSEYKNGKFKHSFPESDDDQSDTDNDDDQSHTHSDDHQSHPMCVLSID